MPFNLPRVTLLTSLGLCLIGSGCSSTPRLTSASPTAIVSPRQVHDVATHEASSTSTETTTESSTSTKFVALTFDDGPYGTSTREILDILKEKSVHATFFLLGKNSQEFPDEPLREVTEGHEIGNHSFDHSMQLPSMTAAQFSANLDQAETAIATSTGIHPTLFRPPYGALSTTMRQVLKTKGYSIALWNVDPTDWNYVSSTSVQVVQRILSAVKPNSVILLHDGRDTQINAPRDNTVNALPTLIDDLRAQGYEFLTISELREQIRKQP